MTAYQPGSFFLARISGTTGYAIQLAQAIVGDASRWTHGGVIINADGAILEAEPGGARISNLSAYAGRPLLISDAPVRRHLAANPGTSEEDLRLAITFAAHDLIGVGYSFLDYLALALLHLHLPSGWVRRRVVASKHAMCSQLVDMAFEQAGIHLFNDGRLPGDVMPADLAGWAEDAAATS